MPLLVLPGLLSLCMDSNNNNNLLLDNLGVSCRHPDSTEYISKDIILHNHAKMIKLRKFNSDPILFS